MNRVFNRTKIVATVGPASSSYKMLESLVDAGVDVFRLNFSHGNHQDHEQVIQRIQRVNKNHGTNAGILADLQGPKIRIGELEYESVNLEDGASITFTTKECKGDSKRVYLNYKSFPKDVKKGESILVDDGKIELKVISTNKKDEVRLKVIHGGLLRPKKGVNLPNTKINIPSLTKKDLADLEFILKQEVDWIALSFVRAASDLKELRKLTNKKSKYLKLIAKIEKPEAIEHLDEIIAEADGVMIARGDLGVEVPMDKMSVIQKDIVTKCIHAAKPVIIATQMMESMINSPKPTRAEISDVANGVFDGADALMLSAETAVGKFPVKVIETIESILHTVEKQEVIFNKDLNPHEDSPSFLSDAVCYNACRIAKQVEADAILGMTRSGYTAFMISSFRPKSKIFIFTDNKAILNTLSLSWGVRAYYYDSFVSTDETMDDVINLLRKKKRVKKGEIIINTGSMPIHEQGRTNMLKVYKIK